MGYHIVNIYENSIDHVYVENKLDIAYVKNIHANTIIYQGEKHWKPVKIGNDPIYKNYTKDWFRAGLKAQELFKSQAKSERLMIEELFQDVSSFQQYLVSDKYLPLKRGDFLIRNYGNIEVDIKCRNFYKSRQGKTVFNFKCEDVDRHINMQSLTKTPILIAVYERDGDNVKEHIPYFFSIDKAKFSILNKINLKKNNVGLCYQIPLEITTQSFNFIKNYQFKKTYSVAEKRIKHKNAYKKWSSEDDELLEINFCENKSISELSTIFGRNKSAIRSRIRKLELDIKYNR